MDHTYDDLNEEPWPFIERMTVEVYYASEDLGVGWYERKVITKKDLIHWVENKATLTIFAPWQDEPDVVLEVTDDRHFDLLMAMIVRKVHCKAGITLKNPFDITELFFESYNPTLLREWERKFGYPPGWL